jgi:hypothetical protein
VGSLLLASRGILSEANLFWDALSKYSKCNQHNNKLLPEFFSCILEAKYIYQQSQEKIDIDFLNRVLKPLENIRDAEWFFGKSPNVRDAKSLAVSYSFYDTTYNAIVNITNKALNEDITIGDIEYLTVNLTLFDSAKVDSNDVMQNQWILESFESLSYRGLRLPTKTIEYLSEVIVRKNNKDIHMNKQLALILCYSWRNDVKLTETTIDKINEVLDFGRISAANAIGDYVEKYGVEILDVDKVKYETLESLEKLCSRCKQENKELFNAANFALQIITRKVCLISVDGLEDDLLDAVKMDIVLPSFLIAAMAGKALSMKAVNNLATICTGDNYSEKQKIDAAAALDWASELGNFEIPALSQQKLEEIRR